MQNNLEAQAHKHGHARVGVNCEQKSTRATCICRCRNALARGRRPHASSHGEGHSNRKHICHATREKTCDKADPCGLWLDSNSWRTAKNDVANPCEMCPKSFSLKTKNTGDGERKASARMILQRSKHDDVVESWIQKVPCAQALWRTSLGAARGDEKKQPNDRVSDTQSCLFETTNNDIRKRRGQLMGLKRNEIQQLENAAFEAERTQRHRRHTADHALNKREPKTSNGKFACTTRHV